MKVSKQPLMPSPESSVLDLGGEYEYAVQSVKKEKKKPVIDQNLMIANIVKKSLELQKRDDKIRHEAESLFESKKYRENRTQ